MDTHRDGDFYQKIQHPGEFMRRLQARADATRAAGESQITGGKPDEEELDSWKAANGVHVRHLPPDEQGILRISVGGGIEGLDGNYCVFRGDRVACAFLLEMALHALRGGKPGLRKAETGDIAEAPGACGTNQHSPPET